MTQDEVNEKKAKELNKLIAATVTIIGTASVLGDAGAIKTVALMSLMSASDVTKNAISEPLPDIDSDIADIQSTKTWKHGMYLEPEQPRDGHVSMDGETVDVTDDFSIGYDPRDSIDPGAVFNCGCGIENNFDGEIYTVDKVTIRTRYDYYGDTIIDFGGN